VSWRALTDRPHARRRPALVAATGLGTLAAPAIAFAHGDRVAVSELESAWEPAAGVIGAAAVAVALFAQGWLRLRRRGRCDLAGLDRALLFAAGLALLVFALVSPLDAIAQEYLLSAHMLQHVLIGDAAVALLVLAVRGPIVYFLLPQSVMQPFARSSGLRALTHFLLRPGVSLAIWALSLAVWHIPAVYKFALTHPFAHDLEHATFIFAGVLVWVQLIDPARRHALRRSGRLAFALIVFACGQVLADVLVFSFEPLYGAYAAQDERLLGLSPQADQQLAGLVMMGEQLVTLGTFVALTLVAAHRGARAVDRRRAALVQRSGAKVEA
jgi:putative membrane protein